jgi:hypothetical protein
MVHVYVHVYVRTYYVGRTYRTYTCKYVLIHVYVRYLGPWYSSGTRVVEYVHLYHGMEYHLVRTIMLCHNFLIGKGHAYACALRT